MINVLGEIPNRLEALKEIFDSLKAHGILSITEIIFDPHYQSRAKVTEIAQKVEFKKIQEFGNWIGYTSHFQKTKFSELNIKTKQFQFNRNEANER